MKIRSKTELQDIINDDISERKKEIINLKGLLKKAKEKNEILLAKCLVIISYSHWEGFVKNSSRYYMNYIKQKGIKSDHYSQQLRSSLFFRQIIKKSGSVPNKISFVEDLLYNHYQLAIDENDLCDTESNLDYKTLKKLLYNIGLHTIAFDTKEIFLDERIVGDRNKFAHGELQPYTSKDAIEIADTVIELMDKYKTEIDNAVELSSYLQQANI